MVKRKLQINCLKTLAILLIAGLFASGIACADEELTAEELLTQCKNKYAYAEDLWELGRYDEIKTLYQYISENCPDSDLVMKSQIWTAGCDIHLGNYSAADKMIETVKNKYSQQENLCAELDSLCDEYWIMQKYDKAKALYQYIAQNSSDSDLPRRARTWAAGCEIYLGNDSAVDQAITELMNDYSESPGFYHSVLSIVREYEKLNRLDKAKAICQYVAQNSSNSDLALSSQTWAICFEIKSGNDAAAEQATEKLKNDYSESPGLCNSISILRN